MTSFHVCLAIHSSHPLCESHNNAEFAIRTGTEDLAIFNFPLQGYNVYLIDTPGFDDTNRSDVDTLKLIAHYLSVSYANRVCIGGIVYLHRISDNRVTFARSGAMTHSDLINFIFKSTLN